MTTEQVDAAPASTALVETEGLDRRQVEAGTLLAEGKCYREAAEAIHVDPQTIYRWMKGELRAYVERVRRQVGEQALSTLSAHSVALAGKLAAIGEGKVTAKTKQVDAIGMALGYTIGSSKGGARGLTLHAGAGSFEGAHITIGYPGDHCPKELDQGDDVVDSG